MRRVAFVYLFIMLLCAIPAKAGITEHLKVGHTYAVIWAFRPDGVPIREFITIRKMDKSGWVLAENPGFPHTWWVNLSQALQIKDAEEFPNTPPPTRVPSRDLYEVV